MMESSLKAWRQLSKEERQLTDEAWVRSDGRMEAREPKDGLILAMYTRDLPENGDASSTCQNRWNRDTAWFTKDEAHAMIPHSPTLGQEFALSDTFVHRVVMLHMVDMVNGQTDPFDVDEISGSHIEARVTKVSAQSITLELSGETKAGSSKTGRGRTARGVVTSLMGSATFDLKAKMFSQFEIVAVGGRHGKTRFNDRAADPRDSNPIGFVFQLASDAEPPIVPAFIWGYQVPWVYE